MKKIKIGSIVLFVCSILIFGAYKIYERMNRDVQAPVISCESEELVVSVAATEEELLQYVEAKDDKSGDVSDTLVIESITPFTDESTRVITYAAIDEKGNVSRLQRTLKYTDYQEPRFLLSQPLRFPTGETANILGRVSAQSGLDGDLGDNIKYTLDSTMDLTSPGTYQIEFRVTDSAGKVTYLPTEVEIYERTEERIQVNLKSYLIYISKNAAFDPKTYFADSDAEDGKLTIQSNVNVSEAGVYQVNYIVQDQNSIGKSRLVVVVTEP